MPVASKGSKSEKAVKTRRTKKTAKTAKTAKKQTTPRERREKLFALDIGTRSVIGIVAERNADGTLSIVATHRQEHKTRAMLDGQIHDVPQVAAVIGQVTSALKKEAGNLKEVAVAAAGRALYTMTAEAELELSGIITAEQERQLDFAGVQAAQAKLASSEAIDDPTRYYCVGYSTIKYILDDNPLKTLVGQRGKIARAQVIATFLPRQVIDSMDSALTATKLQMRALTLEPIAAINVLIPPTMRHLNLVLVDIGAGTSDVAITKNGSVIAYGMVPQAGDEITEAISQKYLLDFNVAERIKREATNGQDVSFTDILGMPYQLKAEEVIDPILPSVRKLAEAIAHQITELNGAEPQAVLLVGGGALTPQLDKFIAEALSLPSGRVAVRHPEVVDDITEIPAELRLPDAVTPLGILKIASLNTLHFLTITVNGKEHRLFNFRDLTVSDALLHAGVNLKKFNGKPGLGLMLNIDGRSKFIPGTMGTMAELKLNGESAELDSPIADGSVIEIIPGEDGTQPLVTLADVLEMPPEYNILLNGQEKKLRAHFLINGIPAAETQSLKDGDEILSRKTRSIGEALNACGYSPTGKKISYTLNGSDTQYSLMPDLKVNGREATISMDVCEGDRIEYRLPAAPLLGDVLSISEMDACLVVYFNGNEHKIPSATISLEVNGEPATTSTPLTEGCEVRYDRSDRRATSVSTALLAVGFEPPPASTRAQVDLFVNGKPAMFNAPIKNGDSLEVKVTTPDGAAVPASIPGLPGTSAKPQAPLKDSLLGGTELKESLLSPQLKDSLLGNEPKPKLKDSLLGPELRDSLLGNTPAEPAKPKLKDGLLSELLGLK